jgi:hypothetical protein
VSETTISKNNVIVRLPDERWQHIIERHRSLMNHKELILETIMKPDRILDGNEGSLMAIREIEQEKVLVVVYKENSSLDGFVVTAFPTRRLNSLNRRIRIWP